VVEAPNGGRRRVSGVLTAWQNPAVVAPRTLDVAPRWQILPQGAAARDGAVPLRMTAGAGFGDGTHPTTQVCLQAIAALAPRGRSWRLLDFGSGSGVLSIAGARLGAVVEAVEIDPAAIEHAHRNFAANDVAAMVRQRGALDARSGSFDLVVANILRAVLVAFAEPLVGRLAVGGALILSGLVSTDVPEVSHAYARLLGARPEVYERDEWRALVWR
jgi:ribosomal protein L11 methyltransferase